MRRDAIMIKRQDNVATAIRDIPAGKTALVGIEEEVMNFVVSQDIPFGHKLAVCGIGKGEEI
jgi:altronate dehydratase small subunit